MREEYYKRIQNLYLDNINNGIFRSKDFNTEMINIWKQGQKRELNADSFISIVAEVVGPCVHQVDFLEIYKNNKKSA